MSSNFACEEVKQNIAVFRDALTWDLPLAKDVKKYVENHLVMLHAKLDTDAFSFGPNIILDHMMEIVAKLRKDEKMFIFVLRESHTSPVRLRNILIYVDKTSALPVHRVLEDSGRNMILLANDENVWNALVKNETKGVSTLNERSTNTFHVFDTVKKLLEEYKDGNTVNEVLANSWEESHDGFALVFDNSLSKVVDVVRLDGLFPNYVKQIYPGYYEPETKSTK